MKEITIIIPLYNAASYIIETLESVVKQSFKNWECLVFDDGSTDDSFNIAKSFCKNETRIKVAKRPNFVPKGPSGIRNYGIEISQSPFVCFLDADDIMHPKKLELQYNLLIKNPNKIGCISRSFHFEGSVSNLTRPWKKGVIDENILDNFCQSTSGWQTGDPLWRKKNLPEKMFDEQMFGPDDWIAHIFLLLQYNFENFLFIQDILLYIRVLPVSLHTEPSLRRLKSDVLSRKIVLENLPEKKISCKTKRKLVKDLLSSAEESIKFGKLNLGLNALTLATKYTEKDKLINILQVWLIGLPSMYFFKKGYKYFRF